MKRRYIIKQKSYDKEDIMIPWADNFSYQYYRTILQTINENFQVRLIAEAPQFLSQINGANQRQILLLRHDIDFDLESAERMAEVEHEMGISSCYMIMTTCPFYDIREHAAKLKQIQQLGHGIGLHIDFQYVEHYETSENEATGHHWVVSAIERHAQQLETVIGSPVRSVSYHRPAIRFLRGPLFIAERVNAYADDLMQWYLSDSKGQWREGDPLTALRHPRHSLLQLLIHPIWWGEEHRTARDRLQSFFELKTRGLSSEQIQTFDQILANHVSIRRSGLPTQIQSGA